MSRFARAFEGAISNARPPISRTEAAALAGYDAPTLSRLLNGETKIQPKHVAGLLRAISDSQDKIHCLTEYLFDCSPKELRDEIMIVPRRVNEDRPKPQREAKIAKNIAKLDELALDNKDLRELIDRLVTLLSD